MPRPTEQEQQEIIRYIQADKPLPDKYRFLLFEDKREVELRQIVKVSKDTHGIVKHEVFTQNWTGDYIFENEWQSFRTKKDRKLELTSVFHECTPGQRKLAVKVVNIFGNDTMSIVDVAVGGKRQ